MLRGFGFTCKQWVIGRKMGGREGNAEVKRSTDDRYIIN